jgi:hypothetical protein
MGLRSFKPSFLISLAVRDGVHLRLIWLRFRLVCRLEREQESGTVVQFALRANCSAMRNDDVFRDR